jgi:hypothetical protein
MDPQKDYHACEESGSILGQLIHLSRTVTLLGYWNSQLCSSQSTSMWRQSTRDLGLWICKLGKLVTDW